MFEGTDPFAGVDTLMPRQDMDVHMDPLARTPPFTQQPVAGPSTSRLSQPPVTMTDPGPSTSTSSHNSVTAIDPIPGKGWFVAFHAVLPGVERRFGLQSVQRQPDTAY